MKMLLIGLTSIFTVIAQIILKYGQHTLYWPLAYTPIELMRLIWFSLTNNYVLASLLSTITASVCWLLTIQVVPLSRAYPFMGINYVVVYVLSLFLFGETINLYSTFGMVLVVIGTMFLGCGIAR